MRVRQEILSFRRCSHVFESFVRSYLTKSIPFLVNGLTSDWPAMNNWSLPRISQLYGRKVFSCGNSIANNSPIIMTLDDYLLHCKLTHNSPSDCHSPLYIFDSTFEEDCEALLKDYCVPSLFTDCVFSTIPADFRPNYRWFLVGGTGSGSMLHVDPLCTSAWNALATGKKRWLLIEPPPSLQAIPCLDVLEKMSSLIPTSFTRSRNPSALFQACEKLSLESAHTFSPSIAYLEESNNQSIQFELQNGLRCVLFTQNASQIVFVPHGWPHAVLNVELSIAITHNFLPPSTLRSIKSTEAHSKLCNSIMTSWCTDIDVPDTVVETVWHRLSRRS